MTFPLYILLFPFAAFLLAWLIFSMVAFYHMFKLGFKNFTTFFTTFLYLAISIVILAISYNYIIQIDWLKKITVLAGIASQVSY